MKRLILFAIVSLTITLSLSANKVGFSAKVYDENNVVFMHVIADYSSMKLRIVTNDYAQNFKILHIMTSEDKKVMYIGVIQNQLFNNGNYDASKEESLIFDLVKSTFSIGDSNRKLRIEYYDLAGNL